MMPSRTSREVCTAREDDPAQPRRRGPGRRAAAHPRRPGRPPGRPGRRRGSRRRRVTSARHPSPWRRPKRLAGVADPRDNAVSPRPPTPVPAMSDVTRILSAIDQGDPGAAEQLLPLVYDQLRRLAAEKLAGERPGQTLQATALVHEAYLRLVDA